LAYPAEFVDFRTDDFDERLEKPLFGGEVIQQGLLSDSRFFRYRGERDQVVPLCQESCPSSGESTRPGLLDAASSRRGLSA